jgi:hypothetical protein
MGQLRRKMTERNSYHAHGPALYTAQPCGASNNGSANDDPSAHCVTTPDVTASTDLITIQSALERCRGVA